MTLTYFLIPKYQVGMIEGKWYGEADKGKLSIVPAYHPMTVNLVRTDAYLGISTHQQKLSEVLRQHNKQSQ